MWRGNGELSELYAYVAYLLIGTGIVLALLIPLTAIIGQWARGGAITVASIGAALCIGGFWFTTDAFLPQYPMAALATSYLGLGGGALFIITSWALALDSAVRSRRWGWFAVIWLAVYITPAAAFGILITPLVACAYFIYPTACTPQNHMLYWLLVVGSLVGPAVLLAYGLRYAPRARPDGASVSHLDATESPFA